MHEYDTSTYNETKTYKHITINILYTATREALRKKERACRAQRTRSQLANENVKQKDFVRFYFWSARI